MLRLGNLSNLRPRNATHLLCAGILSPLGDPRSLLEKNSCRRALQDELKRAIAVDGDQSGNNHPVQFFSPIVELLHELTDVDTVRPQRGSHGRRRRSLTTRDLNLDLRHHVFCHRNHPKQDRLENTGAFKAGVLRESDLLDLPVFEFHFRRAAKDLDHDLHLAGVIIKRVYLTLEILERAFLDLNRFTH